VEGKDSDAVDIVASSPVEQGPMPAVCLTFTVIGARGFRNSDWMPGQGKPDCYVVVKSKDKEIVTTQVVTDSMDPVWKEEYEYEEWEAGAELEFHLYDKDVIGSDYLGKAIIEYNRFEEGFHGDLQLEETDTDGQNEKYRAYLRVKIKPPGKFYPRGPLHSYDLTLSLGDAKSYALDVDTQDRKTLFIVGVGEGPASEYNSQATAELQLVRGDFIIEANGAFGNSVDLLQRFKDDNEIAIKIRRAQDATLIMERKSVTNEDGTEGSLQPLGIVCPDHPKGEGLVILELNEGLFMDWNEMQTDNPASQVYVGDRITRVGNVSGSAENIEKAIQEVSGKFQLGLVRAAPELFEEEA